MAIVVGDRRYVTLKDDFHINGTKVLEAYANGVKVYPDKSVHLEGNPYVVKYCGSATFSFDSQRRCLLSRKQSGSFANGCWFTLTASFSVVLAIYSDYVKPVVLGNTYSYPGMPDDMIGTKAIRHGDISKIIVLDITTSLQTTDWTVQSPTGSYDVRWYNPACFTHAFNGVHHGGGIESVIRIDEPLFTKTGKELSIPDRLVQSDAMSDGRVIEDVKKSPHLRERLYGYVSADDLYATFSNVRAGSSICGVNVVTSDKILLFGRQGEWSGNLSPIWSYGTDLYYTNPSQMKIPITEIKYWGLASDLEKKYDFTTSANDFKNLG